MYTVIAAVPLDIPVGTYVAFVIPHGSILDALATVFLPLFVLSEFDTFALRIVGDKKVRV